METYRYNQEVRIMDENKSNTINDEIMAVIAAAIASMQTRPGYSLVVRSMKRVPQYSPVWNTVGRIERINNDLNS